VRLSYPEDLAGQQVHTLATLVPPNTILLLPTLLSTAVTLNPAPCAVLPAASQLRMHKEHTWNLLERRCCMHHPSLVPPTHLAFLQLFNVVSRGSTCGAGAELRSGSTRQGFLNTTLLIQWVCRVLLPRCWIGLWKAFLHLHKHTPGRSKL
jgi:hypothetical protein